MSDLTLYTAMSGLQAASYRQELQANNLANAEVDGFRAQIGRLRSVPFQGPAPDRGHAMVVTEDAGYSPKSGALARTDSPWDVALSGPGWLAAKAPNGTLILTRAGRLHRGDDGLLRDGRGDAVLGVNRNPISLPRLDKLEIGADGTISGVPTGQGSRQAQQFNRLFLAETPPGHLVRLGNSRFEVPENAPILQADTATRVKQGYLERSNVNTVQAMTSLIGDTRLFQLETRIVQLSNNAAQGLNTPISQG
jgi:flagellar basal-body rod protein FlgF